MQVVIDTNIWVKAISPDEDYDFLCDSALMGFMNKPDLMLALDVERKIQSEYEDNLIDNRKYQLLIKRLLNTQRMTYVSSNIVSKHENNLLKLGFHEPEDHIFVGTAMNADKIIITEDSDYGIHGESDKKTVYDYMKDEMKLNVFSAPQALEDILR